METDYFKVNTVRQSNSLQMQGGSSGPLWFANLMQCIFIFFSLFIFRWPHSFLLGWCLWWFHCAKSLELSLLSVSSWACLMGASFALWLLLPLSSLGLRTSPRPLDFCLASCQCLWQLVHPLQVSGGRVCSCKCVFMFAWLFGRVSYSCITGRPLTLEVFYVWAWEDTGNLPGAHELLIYCTLQSLLSLFHCYADVKYSSKER